MQAAWYKSAMPRLVVHEPEPGGLLVPANADASWFRVGLQANDIVRYLDGAHVTDLDSLRDGIRRMAEWFLAEGRHLPVVSHLPPETVGAAPVAAAKAAGA
jgi:hypothetical protein